MVLPYFIYPVLSFCFGQGTKVLLKKKKNKKLQWHDVVAYSDMPSGHTATVVSLATIIALKLGFSSPEFALALVFAAIVITDAIGLRNYLGQHGKTLNILVKDLKEDDFLDNSYPQQLEQIGHTPMQVLIGALIGATISVIGFLFF